LRFHFSFLWFFSFFWYVYVCVRVHIELMKRSCSVVFVAHSSYVCVRRNAHCSHFILRFFLWRDIWVLFQCAISHKHHQSTNTWSTSKATIWLTLISQSLNAKKSKISKTNINSVCITCSAPFTIRFGSFQSDWIIVLSSPSLPPPSLSL
jgi:hypothetical protein